MTRATPTAPPILHGRYRIEEQLGTGRLATVYRAYDERLQRRVLVHMLRKELVDQESLHQRFLREAHDSARRSHPTLLEVFDSGEIAGRPYMVTEFVAGRTLREMGALSLEDALLYFRQIVGAVDTCQAAGVPHPPISSNNVILVDDGHVELLENWMTPAADIAIDTASYRSPERSAGGPIAPTSTVYALGLLLFEMLTGRRAISGDDPRTIAQAHQSLQLPSLADVRPMLYIPSLDRLLQQTTARQPSQRPADAATLGQQLDDLRRAITHDTQRLAAPPVQQPTLRQRINRSAEEIIAPRPPRIDRSVPVPAADEPPLPHSPAPHQNTRRSVTGIVVMLTLLMVVACGAYYGASLALATLANIQLPVPEISLPSLPELGVNLPEWLTGVVSGSGEVLVITGVAEEGLNMRDAPGLKSNVIALLPNGTHVRKIDGPQMVDNVPWLHVRASLADGEHEGWVSARFVKTE